MTILQAQQLTKYHAANLILDQISFQVHAKDRIGLIGANGSGKSTLLQMIAGTESIDSGSLFKQKDLKIGYLPQIPSVFLSKTVHEVLSYHVRNTLLLKEEMADLEQQMGLEHNLDNADQLAILLQKYAELQHSFELSGGYDFEVRIEQMMKGLSIPLSTIDRTFGELSGGEQTRVALASQLVAQPDLLLLDEPTNHLDLTGIEWLEQFLHQYPGTVIIVSHDRYFLDRVATSILELEDTEAFTYYTNYSQYVEQKEARLLALSAQYEEQQKQIKQIKASIARLEEWGRNGDNEKFFKRAASMRKALERMEILKRPVMEQPTSAFQLTAKGRSGQDVLILDGVSKQFGERLLMKDVDEQLQYGEKVILMGANGSGKTTLFEMILGTIMPDVGMLKIGSRVTIGYLAQQAPPTTDKQTVLAYFQLHAEREEGHARHILARYLFYGKDVFKPLHSLSGGEWTRLRLAVLVEQQPNLLLLDEPTNHLDIASREALEEALLDFPGTLLAISHDRYFTNKLARRTWLLENQQMHSFIGNYDDFKATRLRQNANQATNQKSASQTSKQTNIKREQAAAKGTSRSLAPTLAELEQTIEQLELQLKQIDAAYESMMETPADVEVAKQQDHSTIAQLWTEREALQAELDELMLQWLSLQD